MKISNAQNINFDLPKGGENGSLRRMGIRIKLEEDDTTQKDYMLYNTVVGKVKALKDSAENQIREWVIQNWITHDEIHVKKVGKLFFFICANARDRANIITRGSANYQGTLVLFTKCSPHVPFKSTFLRAPIWIKV